MSFNPVGLLRFGLVLLGLFLAIVGFLNASDGDEILLVSLGVLALAITAAPIFMQRNFALWHPVTFILPLVILGVTSKIVYVVTMHERSHFVQETLLLYRRTTVLTIGAIAICVGMFCFLLGYALFPRLKGPTALIGALLNRQWNPNGIAIVALVLVPLSTICFALFVRECGANLTNLSELSQKRFLEDDGGAALRVFSLKYWLYRGAYLSRSAFYVVFTWMLATRRSWWSWSTIVVVITGLQSLAIPLFVDNRTGVILITVDIIALSSFLAYRLNLTKFLFAIVVCLSLVGVMLANRASSTGSAIAVIERTAAGRDFMDVCKTSHIVHAVPNTMPYLYGETLYGWIFAPIPPSVWPNKPRWTELPFMLDEVFAKSDKFIGKNSLPPGIVAELYLNGGWSGVCLGMLVVGIGFRMILTTFERLRWNEFAVLAYSLMITRLTLGTFGADLGTGIIKTALDLLPTMIVLFCVTHRAANGRANRLIGTTEAAVAATGGVFDGGPG